MPASCRIFASRNCRRKNWGKQESWLNQVKEMQLHSDKGLYANSFCHVPQQTVPIENGDRSGAEDKLEKDLAVRAAAASIYSTCNFLFSMEN